MMEFLVTLVVIGALYPGYPLLLALVVIGIALRRDEIEDRQR